MLNLIEQMENQACHQLMNKKHSLKMSGNLQMGRKRRDESYLRDRSIREQALALGEWRICGGFMGQKKGGWIFRQRGLRQTSDVSLCSFIHPPLAQSS